MARVMEILAHLCSIANANFTPWDANPRLQAGILYLQMQILMCGRGALHRAARDKFLRQYPCGQRIRRHISHFAHL